MKLFIDVKTFDKKCDLKENLKQANSTNYALFEKIYENFIQKHAPKKKKMQRANHE